MCDPVSAMMAIGTVMSAYSQYQQGQNQAKAATASAANNQKISEYNAKMQERNAQLQDNAAVDAQGRGAEEGAKAREQYRQANATADAKAGSHGLLASGTIADLQDQNVTFGELNALTVQNNAEREAYGYKVGSSDSTAQAANLRLQGDVGVNNAQYQSSIYKQNGMLSAAGTLVNGGANTYDRYIYNGGSNSSGYNMWRNGLGLPQARYSGGY